MTPRRSKHFNHRTSMRIVPFTSIGDYRLGEWSESEYFNLVNGTDSVKTGSFEGLVVVDKSKKVRLSFEGFNCIALDCYNSEVTLYDHKALSMTLVDILSSLDADESETLTDGEIVVNTALGIVLYFEDLNSINDRPSLIGINDGTIEYSRDEFQPLAKHLD